MAGSTAVSAQALLNDVSLALQETRRQYAAARKRKARAVAADTGVSQWRQRVALTIYTFANHCTLAPAIFLAGPSTQRSQRKREAANALWQERIEEWYLAASVDGIVALGMPSTPWEDRVLRRARVFHAEHTLAQLAVRRNEDGSAPSTTALREHIRTIWNQQERRVGPRRAMPLAWQNRQAFAQWASRWRKRWGGRVGALSVRGHVPVDVRRQKARGHPLSNKTAHLMLFWHRFWAPFLAPVRYLKVGPKNSQLGVILGPQIWGPTLEPNLGPGEFY